MVNENINSMNKTMYENKILFARTEGGIFILNQFTSVGSHASSICNCTPLNIN